MRSLFFAEPGQVEWRDVAAPGIEAPTDAVVRITHATTCDIDALIIRGIAPLPGPFPLGHEAIGVIEQTGADCGGLKPGDRVILTYYDACQACAPCSRHTPNRCDTYNGDLTTRRWHGVGFTETGYFSELVRVRNAATMCVKLPLGADPVALAGLGDNVGFAFEYVVPHLINRPGADVLVMGGGGSIALYAVAFARAAGAGKVVYADADPHRLAIAERFGASLVEGPAPKSLGSFPVTVDASANADSLLCAIRSTEYEGHCSSVGGHFRPVSMPLFQMYARGIHFYTGPGKGLPNIHPALDLILRTGLDLSPVVSEVLPFKDAERAMKHPSLKPVFVASH